jgi:arylsulfatase A-like enzyme
VGRGRFSRFAALVACLFAMTAAVAAHPARAAQPNILVIVTDDQRQGTLREMPNTRHFFFDEGRYFQRGFVTTPNCCPSRASIFTGLFAHNHGIRSNGTADLPQSVTVQRYLHDAGYKTAILGKYLNSWSLAKAPPYFDRWAVIRPDSYVNADFNIDGRLGPVSGYSTDVIGSRTVKLLRAFDRQDDKPWFLYVAPVAPHRPATPAPNYAAAPVPPWVPSPAVLEADRSDKPPWVRNRSVPLATMQTERDKMLRTLMSADDMVGKVFHELHALDERRDTLAIFLSDNGYAWGEHGIRGKWRPYTESIRVPLAMRWPGHFEPGSIDTGIATNVDLAPTIMAAAGLSPAAPMDGVSLLQPGTRQRLFTEFWGNMAKGRPDWAQIRTRRVAYIEYYRDGERSNPIFREYYRIDRDGWQLQNLLHDGDRTNNPALSHWKDLITLYAACAGSTCPGSG